MLELFFQQSLFFKQSAYLFAYITSSPVQIDVLFIQRAEPSVSNCITKHIFCKSADPVVDLWYRDRISSDRYLNKIFIYRRELDTV